EKAGQHFADRALPVIIRKRLGFSLRIQALLAVNGDAVVEDDGMLLLLHTHIKTTEEIAASVQRRVAALEIYQCGHEDGRGRETKRAGAAEYKPGDDQRHGEAPCLIKQIGAE